MNVTRKPPLLTQISTGVFHGFCHESQKRVHDRIQRSCDSTHTHCRPPDTALFIRTFRCVDIVVRQTLVLSRASYYIVGPNNDTQVVFE